MSEAMLEHANITVPDANKTADMLCRIFGWRIRRSGSAIDGGVSIHVGGEGSYLAVYTPKNIETPNDNSYTTVGGLNHVGVLVHDIAATEAKVKEAGLETYSHADYAPGLRFYFRDHDGIEFEVVSYPDP